MKTYNLFHRVVSVLAIAGLFAMSSASTVLANTAVVSGFDATKTSLPITAGDNTIYGFAPFPAVNDNITIDGDAQVYTVTGVAGDAITINPVAANNEPAGVEIETTGGPNVSLTVDVILTSTATPGRSIGLNFNTDAQNDGWFFGGTATPAATDAGGGFNACNVAAAAITCDTTNPAGETFGTVNNIQIVADGMDTGTQNTGQATVTLTVFDQPAGGGNPLAAVTVPLDDRGSNETTIVLANQAATLAWTTDATSDFGVLSAGANQVDTNAVLDSTLAVDIVIERTTDFISSNGVDTIPVNGATFGGGEIAANTAVSATYLAAVVVGAVPASQAAAVWAGPLLGTFSTAISNHTTLGANQDFRISHFIFADSTVPSGDYMITDVTGAIPYM